MKRQKTFFLGWLIVALGTIAFVVGFGIYLGLIDIATSIIGLGCIILGIVLWGVSGGIISIAKDICGKCGGELDSVNIGQTGWEKTTYKVYDKDTKIPQYTEQEYKYKKVCRKCGHIQNYENRYKKD